MHEERDESGSGIAQSMMSQPHAARHDADAQRFTDSSDAISGRMIRKWVAAPNPAHAPRAAIARRSTPRCSRSAVLHAAPFPLQCAVKEAKRARHDICANGFVGDAPDAMRCIPAIPSSALGKNGWLA
jgi:hypothetical protein